jgi:hypothetical protein
MTQSCNSQSQPTAHPDNSAQSCHTQPQPPAHPDNSAQSCHPEPQHTGDSGQCSPCAPVETTVYVAPHDGGWNAGGDVHQAALISADVLAHVNSHETLDVSASVLHCEVLDAHVCADFSCAHA